MSKIATAKTTKTAKSAKARPKPSMFVALLVELRLLKEQGQIIESAAKGGRSQSKDKSEFRIHATTKADVGLGLVAAQSDALHLLISVAYDVSVIVEAVQEPIAKYNNEYRGLFSIENTKGLDLANPPPMNQVMTYVSQVEWACRIRAQSSLAQMGLNIALPRTSFESGTK